PAAQTTTAAKQPGGDLLDDLDSILGMPPPVTSTTAAAVSAPSVPQQQQQEPAKKADPFSGLGLDSLGFSMGPSGAKAPVPSQPAPQTTGSFMDVFSPAPGPSQGRTITA
ncbi:hypothetical protein FOZ63_024765, partial [Perkinsus olseni]